MDATYNLNGGFKPTAKRRADLEGPDFYPTPRWATAAFIDNEKFHGDVWECACGDGSMSDVILDAGNHVMSSDLYDRRYGETGHDFMTSDRRVSNGSQHDAVTGLALAHPIIRVWAGYWQRNARVA